MQALAEIGGHCIRCPALRPSTQPTKLCRKSEFYNKLWSRRARFSSNTDPKLCHYDILGVNKNASQSEIKAAFLKKTKEMHPDLNPDDPSMHARFVRLNEAYSILSKRMTRREYDFSLAAQLAYQQNLRHHSYDTSRMPGSGTYRSSNEAKPFWDETIFEMRDKSQDHSRFYQEENFYGVKGVRRLPNSYIVLGCFALMAAGFVLHIAALQYSKSVARHYMDERDRKAHAHLSMVRRRARENGNAKQLELLTASLQDKDKKSSGTPDDS